jgi:hypothetical protein
MAARKTTKRPEAKAPERVKVNIVLPMDVDTLLGVVAAKLRTNKSAIIADALKPTLKGWYVSQRDSGPGQEPTADQPPLDHQAA